MFYIKDLTDWQQVLIKPHFHTSNYGKSRKPIVYVMKTGCLQHLLPKNFPSYKTVYSFYKPAKDQGIFEKMMKDLVEKSRISIGYSANLSYS